MSGFAAPNIVLVAAGRVAVNGGAGTAAFIPGTMIGFSPDVTYNGVGDYTCTIPQCLTNGNVALGHTIVDAAGAAHFLSGVCTPTTPTNTDVHVIILQENVLGSVAADKDFWVLVYDIQPPTVG